MEYGLVFAGGGVRGAYHTGVWKALRELRINVSAACGTSIGAVMAALFCGGDYKKAERLWSEISLADIVALPADIRYTDDLFKPKNLKSVIKNAFASGGLDMTPFEELLKRITDENKIRKSNILLGITAFSVDEGKPVYINAADIPSGELVDYLMASVCLIGFKPRRINGRKFIDAGFADNMPVSFLLERGIKNIITSDAKGIGLRRDRNEAGCSIIRIECRRPRTGTMDFDSGGILSSMKNGYLDAKKAFGRLGGKIYAFNIKEYINLRRKYSADIIDGVEYAADIMNIDDTRVYGFDELCAIVMDTYAKKPHPGIAGMRRMLGGDGFLESKLDSLSERLYLAASALMYLEGRAGGV